MSGENESRTVVEMGMKTEIVVTDEQKEVIKNTVFPGAEDDELKLFIFDCKRRGVHPLDRLIHPVVRTGADGKRKLTLQASIDYYRSESEASGTYAGMDEPEFGEETEQGYPEYAKVTVFKFVRKPDGTHEKVGFTATARWKEFYPGEKLGFMWKSKPFHMLAKCAEVQARRMAWPKLFHELYTPEEMQRADVVDVTPDKKSDTVKPAPKAQPKETASQGEGKGEPAQVAPNLAVKDQLRKELAIYCGMDIDYMKAVLKDVSVFGPAGNEKYISSIESASDKWCVKALEKLRTRTGEEPGKDMPEGCASDPLKCDESTYSLGVALCAHNTLKDSMPCPFGMGINY